MNNIYLFLLLNSIFLSNLQAQFGPGGVGNSTTNSLWLNANSGTSSTTNNDPVNLWNDQSGNANHVFQANANQQPLFIDNFMNGYPSILFDNNFGAGQNDFMQGVDSPSLDNTNGLTIFTVTRRTATGDARSIIAKRTNVGVNQAYMFFYWSSDYLNVDIVGNDNRFTTNPFSFGTGVNRILNLHYDGTLAANQRSKVYNGQTLLTTSTESNNTIPDYNSPLLVGTTHVGDNRAFGGYISEIIIFRIALNNTQRILVDNYLSAKYNIPLATNDFYTMDNPANGNYDHEMAGIGRVSATDLSDDGMGTSLVRINSPSNLNDNEFMMWAHDNGDMTSNNIVDVDGVQIESRLNRVWRLSETGDLGTVNVIYDLNSISSYVITDLRLLIDRNGNGFFDNDVAPISGIDIGGGQIQFTGIDFQNGDRFTLGSINLFQTPLPIQLVHFDVKLNNYKTVDIIWKTASEVNNDYFLVEKSIDGIEWNEIGKINGAGNSSNLNSYYFEDTQYRFNLVNYYRIKQVDFDGVYTYTNVKSVFEQEDKIIIYPNPALNKFEVSTQSTIQEIVLYNSLGQKINESKFNADISGNHASVDIDLSSGIYIVVVKTNHQLYREKLIIE